MIAKGGEEETCRKEKGSSEAACLLKVAVTKESGSNEATCPFLETRPIPAIHCLLSNFHEMKNDSNQLAEIRDP